MKNYLQPGEVMTAVAPVGGVVSGTGYIIGDLFGIATTTAAQAAEFELATKGVFEVTKLSAQAWTLFQKVYWDAGNARATTVSTSNRLIGVAAAVAANPSATGKVRLDGASLPAAA